MVNDNQKGSFVPKTKEERVIIANKIITAISERGRRFFYDKKSNYTAYLHLVNGRIYYKCESVYNNKTDLCFSVKPGFMRGWYHGGTLQCLIYDLCDYIKTGKYSNHNNGYGGLYCPHWGYKESEMKEIQKIAIDLGYLESEVTS